MSVTQWKWKESKEELSSHPCQPVVSRLGGTEFQGVRDDVKWKNADHDAKFETSGDSTAGDHLNITAEEALAQRKGELCDRSLHVLFSSWKNKQAWDEPTIEQNDAKLPGVVLPQQKTIPRRSVHLYFYKSTSMSPSKAFV